MLQIRKQENVQKNLRWELGRRGKWRLAEKEEAVRVTSPDVTEPTFDFFGKGKAICLDMHFVVHGQYVT